LLPLLQEAGFRLGPLTLAEHARVALGDEVGPPARGPAHAAADWRAARAELAPQPGRLLHLRPPARPHRRSPQLRLQHPPRRRLRPCDTLVDWKLDAWATRSKDLVTL
jgi:hypothetical protein